MLVKRSMGIFWETSFWAFFFLTVVIGGGAGRGCRPCAGPANGAHSGRSFSMQLACSAAADRFLHWGLFLDKPLDVYKGDLFSIHYYLVDTSLLIAERQHRLPADPCGPDDHPVSLALPERKRSLHGAGQKSQGQPG